MEALEAKLQGVVISESNSNHIINNSSSHSVKLGAKNENFEERKCCNENGHAELSENELVNGLQSPCIKGSSSDNEESTEVSELSHHPADIQVNQTKPPSCIIQEFEVVEMLRELPDKSTETVKITYKVYESELELPSIMKLIQKDLSEPYSIYTYRYFIHNWPKLCYLALYENKCIGCIVCKLDIHRQMIKRGYIAMLAVDKDYRKLKIGTTLVQKAIRVNISYRVVTHSPINKQMAHSLITYFR
jgi:GNAT superfamily N-acetyltransferase